MTFFLGNWHYNSKDLNNLNFYIPFQRWKLWKMSILQIPEGDVAKVEPLHVAQAIQKVVEKEKFDIVFVGKQVIFTRHFLWKDLLRGGRNAIWNTLCKDAERTMVALVGISSSSSSSYCESRLFEGRRRIENWMCFDELVQAIDDDASQTGPLLAGLLDWPQALYASKVKSWVPKRYSNFVVFTYYPSTGIFHTRKWMILITFLYQQSLHLVIMITRISWSRWKTEAVAR